MQLSNKIIIALIAIIIFLALVVLALLHACSEKKQEYKTVPKVKEVTTLHDLPPAPEFKSKPDSVKVKVYVKVPVYIIDTSAIHNLIAERDSLAKRLLDSNVRIIYSADTVNPDTKDTLSITCDDLKKQIDFSLRYAPRQEKITIRTETYFQEVTWYEKLFYGSIGILIYEGLRQARQLFK